MAESEEARWHGVLVLMHDTIFAARDVTKTRTCRVDALGAPDLGPRGYADADGRVVFCHRCLRLPAGQSPFATSSLDYPGWTSWSPRRRGWRGPTPQETEALDRAIDSGVVVCQSSRVAAGRVVRSSPAMRRRGVVTADSLQPWKARILLSLALTLTSDADEIQALFETL